MEKTEQNRLKTEDTTYKKVGSDVVLSPDKTSGVINDIMWSQGDDLAMEFYGGPGTGTGYRQFKERGSLNPDNGAMTINNLTRSDSGIYTVEINNMVNKKIDLKVLDSVVEPNVNASCHVDYCDLTCEGDTTGAEPVSFNWIIDEVQKPIHTKEYKFTKEDNIKLICCEHENPVSTGRSDCIPNPLISSDDSEDPTYKKEGSDVVLSPDKTSHGVTSIFWKHGDDLAMEFYGGRDYITGYQQFKERGSLNLVNGAMTIEDLIPSDSGIYTVEINNALNKKINLQVLASVVKPNVTASCDDHHCDLTCEGDTTGAEPVSFKWIIDEVQKPIKTKKYKFTKDDNIKLIRCEHENPVSTGRSDSIRNPLITPNPGPSPGVIGGVVIGVVLLVLAICGIVRYLLKKGIIKVPFFPPRVGYGAAASADPEAPNGPDVVSGEKPGPSDDPTVRLNGTKPRLLSLQPLKANGKTRNCGDAP